MANTHLCLMNPSVPSPRHSPLYKEKPIVKSRWSSERALNHGSQYNEGISKLPIERIAPYVGILLLFQLP